MCCQQNIKFTLMENNQGYKNYIRLSFLPDAVRLFRKGLTVLPVVSSREVSITQTAVCIKYTLLNMEVSSTDFKKLSYMRMI